jgi:fructokinase
MIAPQYEIVGLGEVLWDLLPAGRQLGGAPANFICHAHALGASARLISRVGDDPLGREIVTRLAGLGMPTATIAMDGEAPTGTVSIEVSADGQPRFTIHENVAWDRIEACEEALAVVARADAICFGTLAQRTPVARDAIGKLLGAAQPEAMIIFDINLRAPFYNDDVIARSLTVANVLKLNEQELPILARIFELKGPIERQLAALADRFGLRLVALTRGAEGSMLFADGELVGKPAIPTPVLDTVGAGDAFTAALVAGALRGWPLEKIAECAGAIAAYVCSQPGATPPLPEALRAPFLAESQTAAPTNAEWPLSPS